MGTVILMENHRPTCSVPGCVSPIQTRKSGLCIMHNARMKNHGSTDDPRPAGYGEKRDHPLWMRWSQLKRRRELTPEWLDFWAFVEGISPMPDNAKKLWRHRQDEPYGPDNFIWAKTPTRDETLAYYKTWNRANPNARRTKHLADRFNLTLSDYDQMFAAQEGRCAICGEEEKASHKARANGEKRRMAVDHDHATDMVRDLLCTNCNTALGALNDNVDLFKKAIAYIEQWRERHRKESAA